MVLRFLQTIPSLGGIYHTNTNSYQTIPITASRMIHSAFPSLAPTFLDHHFSTISPLPAHRGLGLTCQIVAAMSLEEYSN
jgi:hypothetical protein